MGMKDENVKARTFELFDDTQAIAAQTMTARRLKSAFSV
jgi:hypothetical protein